MKYTHHILVPTGYTMSEHELNFYKFVNVKLSNYSIESLTEHLALQSLWAYCSCGQPFNTIEPHVTWMQIKYKHNFKKLIKQEINNEKRKYPLNKLMRNNLYVFGFEFVALSMRWAFDDKTIAQAFENIHMVERNSALSTRCNYWRWDYSKSVL